MAAAKKAQRRGRHAKVDFPNTVLVPTSAWFATTTKTA